SDRGGDCERSVQENRRQQQQRQGEERRKPGARQSACRRIVGNDNAARPAPLSRSTGRDKSPKIETERIARYLPGRRSHPATFARRKFRLAHSECDFKEG